MSDAVGLNKFMIWLCILSEFSVWDETAIISLTTAITSVIISLYNRILWTSNNNYYTSNNIMPTIGFNYPNKTTSTTQVLAIITDQSDKPRCSVISISQQNEALSQIPDR